MLAEDCGLLTSGKHPELAQRLAALLVQQQREREEEEQAELQGQQERQGAQEQWRLGQPQAPEQPSHQEVGQLGTQSTPPSDLVTFFDRPFTSTSISSGSSSSGDSGVNSVARAVEQGGVHGALSPLRQAVLRRDAAGRAAALQAVNVHQVRLASPSSGVTHWLQCIQQRLLVRVPTSLSSPPCDWDLLLPCNINAATSTLLPALASIRWRSGCAGHTHSTL